MKKCPNCQKVYPDSAQFCMGCGGELEHYDVPPSKSGQAVKGIVKILCYIFLMFGIQNVVSAAFVSSMMLADPTVLGALASGTLDAVALTEQMMDRLLENYTMILLVSNLVTILIISLFFTLRRKNPFQEVMLRPVKGKILPLCALYGAALNIFVSVTMSFLPLPAELLESLDSQYDMLYGQTNVVLEILNAAVLTGLVEEIIFRGLAISRLKRGMSRGAAVVVSAVIFGLCHGVIIAVVYATVLGIVFGFLADRYNSIVPSMVCHIFFNATSYFLVTDNMFVILALYAISIAILIGGSYLLFKKDGAEISDTNE